MGWPVTCFCDQGDGIWLLWLRYIQASGDSNASADLSEWFVGGKRSCLNISPWPSSTSGPNETSTIINGPFVSLCDFFLSCGFESFYLYSWYSAFYYMDSPWGFCLFYSPSEALCTHSVVDTSEPLPLSFPPLPPPPSSLLDRVPVRSTRKLLHPPVCLLNFHACFLARYLSLYSILGKLLHITSFLPLTLPCHRFIQFVNFVKVNFHVNIYYYFQGAIG